MNRKFYMRMDMKTLKTATIISTVVSVFVLTECHLKDEIENPLLLLNPSLPGTTPESFGSDIFTNDTHRLHGFPAMSPECGQIFWPVIPPNLMTISYVDRSWTSPSIAAFSERNIQAPSFTSDGKMLLFQMSDPTGFGGLDIWYVTKHKAGWSQKQNLGSPPNTAGMESQPTMTRSGTLYYTHFDQNGLSNRKIFRSEYQEGKFKTPEPLPESINSGALDYTPFIAPDESFLLFSSTRPGMEEQNIRMYITFRNKDGTWTEPENLNTIMAFDRPSRFPSLTPGGEFIVFLSEGQWYWVSGRIIDQCKNKPASPGTTASLFRKD